MQIKDSRYHKVWEVKEENGFIKVNLGDSRKNKDGEYENCTWFDCLLLGKAKEFGIKKDDVVTIVSGQVFKRKYNDKWYDDIKIFEVAYSNSEQKAPSSEKPSEGFVAIDNFDDDDLPF